MKTLFFPLLLITMILLQFSHTSNTPKKNSNKNFSEIDFTESQHVFENELRASPNDDKNEKDSQRNIQQTTANTTPPIQNLVNDELEFVSSQKLKYSSEKLKYNFEKYLKKENDGKDKEKEKQKQMQKEKHESEIFNNEKFLNDAFQKNLPRKICFEEQQTVVNTKAPMQRILKNYEENEFVSSEKINYNFEKYLKKENDGKEKEKQMQKEKYERELHQSSFSILEILEENYENEFVSLEKKNYNFEKHLKKKNEKEKELEKELQEKYERELHQFPLSMLDILENYENEFVSSEKKNYDVQKYLKKKNDGKEKEKEKQLQEEKHEKELQLHQFLILRKVLIPIIFDEEEDCKSFKKIFLDEEEKEFTKLYETAFPVNHSIIPDDDEQTVEGLGGRIIGSILL